MRQLFFALTLVTSLVLSMLPAAVQAAPAPPFAVVQVERLNVRAAPSLDAPVVGQVTSEERITLRGRNADGTWLRIESAGGISGWVYAELAQPSVPVPALPVLSADVLTTSATASTADDATVQKEEWVKQTVQTAVDAKTTGADTVFAAYTGAPVPAASSATPAPNQDPRAVGPQATANGTTVASQSAALEPLCLPNRLRAVSLGGRPQAVAAMNDRLYVALAGINSLMVVDTGMDMMLGSSRTTAREIRAVTAGKEYLYIADSEQDRLIVTTRQGALQGEIDLPAEPGPVAVTDGRAFVLHPQMGAVSVVDLNSKETIATLSIGADPRQVAVLGGRAFVAHAAGFLSVVDGYGRRQEQLHLPVNDVVSMAANARTSMLYIASAADQKVVAVDTSTWTLANTWTLDVMPSSLAYNAVTDHLFVLDTTSQFLTVLSGIHAERVGRVRVSDRPAPDRGNNLALLQSKLYISHPSNDSLDVWLDRTCPNEVEARSTSAVAATHSRTDLAPRRVEARIGILWPHGGATPDQASFANVTATLIREDGASPACGWEPTVTLWAAIGDAPAKQVAVGRRRLLTEQGITFPVYDFNDVDVRAGRDRHLPIHFSVRVDGVETAQNVWTHSATGQYVPTVRPELEGLVNRHDGALDARLWVERTPDGPQIYAMLLKAGTLLGLTAGAGSPTPQLRWALDNGVTEPELIVGQAETRQEDGLIFTVWRFPGLNPDALLQEATQARFWVEIPDVAVDSSVLAWGNDIRTLGARLPVPIVGCSQAIASR